MQWQRIRNLPAGIWIAGIVLILVGGRFLWIVEGRPPHEQEIVNTYGSVRLFYGAPQTDSQGQHVTFVATADLGYGLFLADTATGHKILVYDETNNDDYTWDLHAWPWSPDDKTFAYSAAGQIVMTDSDTGNTLAQIDTATNISALVWLSPTAFACTEIDGGFYEFKKEADGQWHQNNLVKNFVGGFALRSTDGIGATSMGDSEESLFDQTDPMDWSSGQTTAPIWVQYHFTGPAWAITRYTITSAVNIQNTAPLDWKLLASDDGQRWIELDSRANEIFPDRGQTKQYTFTNQTPYSFYRLAITAQNSQSRGRVSLAKFQLWSQAGADRPIANPPGGLNEDATKAFDGATGTKWYGSSIPPPGWLQYQFGGGAAWQVSRYDLTSANDVPERDPKAWQFQASNDGTNWLTLDTRSGETFTNRFQTKSYSFFNTQPYQIYRLLITANAGNPGDGMQLSELNLQATNALGQLASVSVPQNPFLNIFSLATLSDHSIAWAQNSRIWMMDLVSNTPAKLLLNAPPNTTFRGFSYSKAANRLLLSCVQDGKGSLWSFDLENRASLHEITDPGSIQDACWAKDSWAELANSHLLFAKSQDKPVDLTPIGNIDAFTASATGNKIFFHGTFTNELAAGIWQYDLATSSVQCVVPSTDFVSPYVGQIQPQPISDSIISAGGKYTIYFPMDVNRHPHRKYPLIIGNTDFGVAVNGEHGRLWVPAMVACNAYVVIINRGGWWNNLDKWGADVATAYRQLAPYLHIDKSRVFLFGASAETTYISQFLTNSPIQCRGVILLNPTGLPDLSSLSPFQSKPKILLSAGGLEGEEDRLKQYQANALNSGVMVEYFIAPGEGHHFIGNTGQLQRTKAIAHFVFDE